MSSTHLTFVLFLWMATLMVGCAKDDVNYVEGRYRFSMIRATNCLDPSSNYALDFKDGDCATAFGFEFCQSGAMTLGDFLLAVSTLKLDGNIGLDIGDRYDGLGTYELNKDLLLVCMGDCRYFKISGNTLTEEFISGGCDQIVVLEKI